MDEEKFLRVFAFRGAMMCVLVPCESLLFSMWYSRYSFIRNCVRAAWVLAGVPLGWWLGGLNGVLAVMVATEVPVLIVLWRAAIKHKVFDLWGELRSVLFFAAGLLAGWAFLRCMPEIRIDPILHQIAAALNLSSHKPLPSPTP